MLKFQFLLISLFTLASAQAHAANTRDHCAKAAQVAESLMGARQEGAALQEVMDAMTSSYSRSAWPLAKKMVMDAYSVPRFDSAEYQKRAIGDFRDEMHLKCLRASK